MGACRWLPGIVGGKMGSAMGVSGVDGRRRSRCGVHPGHMDVPDGSGITPANTQLLPTECGIGRIRGRYYRAGGPVGDFRRGYRPPRGR